MTEFRLIFFQRKKNPQTIFLKKKFSLYFDNIPNRQYYVYREATQHKTQMEKARCVTKQWLVLLVEFSNWNGALFLSVFSKSGHKITRQKCAIFNINQILNYLLNVLYFEYFNLNIKVIVVNIYHVTYLRFGQSYFLYDF